MRKMPKWTKAPEALVTRFNAAMEAFPDAQRRTMFGYPAAFIKGQMFAGVFQDRMFLRLPADGRTEIAKAGGGPFEPMPGRPMREYAIIPERILNSRTKLDAWLRRSFEYAGSLGPKKRR